MESSLGWWTGSLAKQGRLHRKIGLQPRDLPALVGVSMIAYSWFFDSDLDGLILVKLKVWKMLSGGLS